MGTTPQGSLFSWKIVEQSSEIVRVLTVFHTAFDTAGNHVYLEILVRAGRGCIVFLDGACALNRPLSVFASAFSIMLPASFTPAMLPEAFATVLSATFAAVLAALTLFASDLRMGGPPVEVLACHRQFDSSFFTRTEVCRSRRAEFPSVGQVNFHSNPFEGFSRCVLHRAFEGTALRVVGQNQPGAVSHLIVGLVQGKFSTGFLAFLITGTVSGVLAPAFSTTLTTVAVVFTSSCCDAGRILLLGGSGTA